jgi:hypothetical protein
MDLCLYCKLSKAVIDGLCKRCMERTQPPELLRCSTCKQWKPYDKFVAKNLTTASGIQKRRFSYRCLHCEALRARAYRRTIKGRFTFAKITARRAKHEFHLTIEQYGDLILQPCHYCKFTPHENGTWLDRVDSAGHYTLDNVVPCCGLCNVIKGNQFTEEEMLLLGPVVSQIKSKRQALGLPLKLGYGRGKSRVYADESDQPS